MRYLLDTNVCARYLNGKSPAIRQRLRAVKRKAPVFLIGGYKRMTEFIRS
ncbi:hypothetical protein [Anabaena sp. FACHB-595]